MRIIRRNILNLNNIKMLRLMIDDFGYAECDSEGWNIERHPPMTSRLFYICSGDPFLILNGKKLYLENGKCYLIPTGLSFRSSCDSYMEFIYFHLRLTDHTKLDILKNCGRVMEYTPEPKLVENLKLMIMGDSFEASLSLRCDLTNSLLKVLEANGYKLKITEYSQEVLKAIEYINQHLSIQLDVDEIAANSLVSVSTLTKKFKLEVGSTVSAYIDNAIMAEAASLLRYSNLTIQQISTHFEFCYQSYFSKRFKAWYGVTPQQYRGKR